MNQGFFESDEAYADRVKREAASKLGLKQGFFESDADYMERVNTSVKYGINNGLFDNDASLKRDVESAVGRGLGQSQGLFESDDAYSQRVKREIGHSVGVSQGLFEDEKIYKTRIDSQLGERADIKLGFFEPYDDYLQRVKKGIAPEAGTGSSSNNNTQPSYDDWTSSNSSGFASKPSNVKEPISLSVTCLMITIINQELAFFFPVLGIILGVIMFVIGIVLKKKLPVHGGLATAIRVLAIISLAVGIFMAIYNNQFR